MKKNKIYLSGAISDNPEYKEVFYEASRRFALTPNVVIINPAVLPWGLAYESYMDICMAMVRACDEVYMLKGWEESVGANLEYTYAKALGKRITFQDEVAR